MQPPPPHRYISPKPNTYTFTKALAEIAVAEHTGRTYPVAIFRPTIGKEYDGPHFNCQV